MAIDINEEVKLWGGFSFSEFWTGAGVLVGLFLSLVLGLGRVTGPATGFFTFLALGGAFAVFWIYKRDLPKGYLARRWKQEGKFLFVHIPGRKGLQVLAPPAMARRSAFESEMES